jgi:F0F1-type ATP synthase membrane subunit b/b'
MDAMFHALGGILLRAVPTFLLVIFLHYYLKIVFFKPLEKVLSQRYESTEGARKAAAASLQQAAEKTAQYEAALRAEKGKMYLAQEERYRAMQERESASLAAARLVADTALKAAKAGLAADVEAAKITLVGDSETLANQIAESILRGNAA